MWTRTLERYTRAGLPVCVVSTMSGLPPKTTQEQKDTHPVQGIEHGLRAGGQRLYQSLYHHKVIKLETMMLL